jgi:hypothetical protein
MSMTKILTENVLVDDHFLYQFASGVRRPVTLQVCTPVDWENGKAECISSIVGIVGAEFTCRAGDSLLALCGAIRLMKEFLIDRYSLGDCLYWLNGSVDDKGDVPVALWLLFAADSLMTDSEKRYNETHVEAMDAINQAEDSQEREVRIAAGKERHRKLKEAPIVNIAASSTYVIKYKNGAVSPGQLTIELPTVCDNGDLIMRLDMTHVKYGPHISYGAGMFSSLLLTLKYGWFSLSSECAWGASVYRDHDLTVPTLADDIFNNLFTKMDMPLIFKVEADASEIKGIV